MIRDGGNIKTRKLTDDVFVDDIQGEYKDVYKEFSENNYVGHNSVLIVENKILIVLGYDRYDHGIVVAKDINDNGWEFRVDEIITIIDTTNLEKDDNVYPTTKWDALIKAYPQNFI